MRGNGARTRQAASAHCLAVQYARTNIRKHSFAVRVEEVWNRLPDQVKTTARKDAFKRMLRKNRPLVRRKMIDQRENKEQKS
jgi:hypothetical protein